LLNMSYKFQITCMIKRIKEEEEEEEEEEEL
jgi:hypothetical protein